jgi:hypothetical protein
MLGIQAKEIRPENLVSHGPRPLGVCLLANSQAGCHAPFTEEWHPALGRVLVVPDFYHLGMMEATVLLGTFNAAELLLVPFPRSVPRQNPVSELYGQFLQPCGLGFALTCTVNSGTYIDRCVPFQNDVQSIELITCELQVVETSSRMANGNRMHLRSILSLKANGLNTYVNKVFLFLVCFIIMGCCV